MENERTTREEVLIKKFREAYHSGKFDDAIKYAFALDAALYKKGIDLLSLTYNGLEKKSTE